MSASRRSHVEDRLRPLAESWERRQDQDVFLIKTDHQLASAHRLTLRHRLVLSGIYNTSALAEGTDGFARALVNGWTFGVIFSAGSGQPYTARVGAFDLNNDGNPRNDIAPGTVRNEFRLPKQVTFDPRVARDVRLGRQAKVQLIWEAFNLFNSDNFSSVAADRYSVNGTTNVLTPTTNFGQPLSSSGPRIMQVAAKFLF